MGRAWRRGEQLHAPSPSGVVAIRCPHTSTAAALSNFHEGRQREPTGGARAAASSAEPGAGQRSHSFGLEPSAHLRSGEEGRQRRAEGRRDMVSGWRAESRTLRFGARSAPRRTTRRRRTASRRTRSGSCRAGSARSRRARPRRRGARPGRRCLRGAARRGGLRRKLGGQTAAGGGRRGFGRTADGRGRPFGWRAAWLDGGCRRAAGCGGRQCACTSCASRGRSSRHAARAPIAAGARTAARRRRRRRAAGRSLGLRRSRRRRRRQRTGPPAATQYRIPRAIRLHAPVVTRM